MNVLFIPAPIVNTLSLFCNGFTGVALYAVEVSPNWPSVFVPHVYVFSSTLWYILTFPDTDISIALFTFDTGINLMKLYFLYVPSGNNSGSTYSSSGSISSSTSSSVLVLSPLVSINITALDSTSNLLAIWARVNVSSTYVYILPSCLNINI